MRRVRVSLAQINPTVGDIAGNVRRIVEGIERARGLGSTVVAFPELAVTGYPPLVVHQSPGMAHDWAHQDYSQVVRLISRLVTICRSGAAAASGFGAATNLPPGICIPNQACTMPNGAAGVTTCMDIYDVGKDPELSALLSHEGPVYMRHWAVPYEKPVGSHPLWSGIQPTPPPANFIDAPPAGDFPRGPALLEPVSPPISVAGVATFLGGLALGYYALGALKK